MGKSKTSKTSQRTAGKGGNDKDITPINGITTDNATVQNDGGDEGSNLSDVGAEKRTRDRSNPPIYAVIGINRTTGAMDVCCTYPTIGRMRKDRQRVQNMVGRFYSELQFARVRYLSEEELSKEQE